MQWLLISLLIFHSIYFNQDIGFVSLLLLQQLHCKSYRLYFESSGTGHCQRQQIILVGQLDSLGSFRSHWYSKKLRAIGRGRNGNSNVLHYLTLFQEKKNPNEFFIQLQFSLILSKSGQRNANCIPNILIIQISLTQYVLPNFWFIGWKISEQEQSIYWRY